MLAIPGAKLYTREMNLAIAMGIKAKSKIYISEALRDELETWRFLDIWQGKLEWKKERHFFFLEIHSDSSNYKWGGVIHSPEGKRDLSDYWEEQDMCLPIMVLEAKALLSVLRTLGDRNQGHRIDANIDSMVLLKLG